jgi:Integrase core domain
MEQVRALSQELGHPSPDKLWQEVLRRDIPVSRADVLQFARAQGGRQVFQKRPKYEGKIVAVEINDRWAADIIDYNARPSPDPKGGPPYQYILIVQDVFSRVIFVHALKTKDQEVCQQAFESIVRRAGLPDELDTDNGNEFKGQFQDYLRDERIRHEVADARNKNARGTLDAAIKSLREQLARIQAVEGRRDWASVLQRAAEAYNKTIHSSLIGRAPYQVHWDTDLQFNLRKRAADDIAHNSALVQRRAAQLNRLGAFREEEPSRNKFERSFTPRFGDAVHRVSDVVGGVVYDEAGRSFPTRHVQAVSAASDAVNTQGMQGGSARIDRVRLEALEPYRQRIEAFVGDGKTENEVVRYMKSLGMAALTNAGFNYRNMLALLGFSTGTGRGSSVAMVSKLAPPAAPAAGPVPPPRAGPLRRITGKRPPMSPAEAASNLRRRITGKQPGV